MKPGEASATTNSKMQTLSGKRFDILDPDPRIINIQDISTALGHIVRYVGHVNFPYTVAEHSILCACVAAPEDKIHALLHDAGEAYIGDVTAPLKWALGNLVQDIEGRVTKAVYTGLRIPDPLPKQSRRIKQIDMRMAITERDQLIGKSPFKWVTEPEPYNFTIPCWTHHAARMQFFQSFQLLKAGDIEGFEYRVQRYVLEARSPMNEQGRLFG